MRVAIERLLPGEQLIKNQPRREDVRRSNGGAGLAVGLGGDVRNLYEVNDVGGDRHRAVAHRLGEVEIGQPCCTVLPDDERTRREVSVDDGFAMRVVQRSQQVLGHTPLLVDGQRHLRARHMHGQRLPRGIVEDQDVGLIVFCLEEISRRNDVRMQRQLSQRPVGVLDAVGFRDALRFGLVRVSLVDTNPRGAASEGVLGA